MTSNKYEKDFNDFNAYNHPGTMLPNMFDWNEAGGDGQPGLQRMLHGMLSAYGSRYVIEGCAPSIVAGVGATGAVGFVMTSGHIIPITHTGEEDLTAGEYLVIGDTGEYLVIAADPTGVIIARNISGTIYDARNRVSDMAKTYLPRYAQFLGTVDHVQEAWFSGDVQITGGDVTGFENSISGFEIMDAKTGAFTNIIGHSDILMKASIDFEDTFHIHGADQITGASANITTLTLAGDASAGDFKITDLAAPTSNNDAVRKTYLDNFALGGDLSGTPGAAVVGNDSHTHDGRYYTEAQIDAYALAGDLGGTLSSPTVDDNSHNHNGTTISTLTHSDMIFTLDNAFDDGKIIDGANNEANAFRVGTTANRMLHFHDGSNNIIKSDNIALEIKGDQGIVIEPWNQGGKGVVWYHDATHSTQNQANATVANSGRGWIGFAAGGTATPYNKIASFNYYKAAGGQYTDYDFVDDLQLLREMHNSPDNLKKPIESKDFEITAYELRTLPWIVAHPDSDNMTDEELNYAFSDGDVDGYILSAMKKILERQDVLVEGNNARDAIIESLLGRINELETNA